MATGKIDMVALWYNTLRGRVIHVLNVGADTYGYGATIDSSFTPIDKWVITSDVIQSLKSHIQIARRHQVGNWTGFTSEELPDVVRGDIPTVEVMNKYEAAVTKIETDRMKAGPSSLSTTATRHTVTRTGMWGSDIRIQPEYGGWRWVATGYPPIITAEVDALWNDFNAARWFFNSGGGITIRLSHDNTSGAANLSWNRSLAGLGPITLRALTTEGSPSRAYINKLGFYHLNQNSYTMILDGTDVDTRFDHLPNYDSGNNQIPNYGFKDDVYIYAKLVPRGVRFKIELREQNRVDYINGGTRAAFSDIYASTYLINPPISQPQYSTVKSF